MSVLTGNEQYTPPANVRKMQDDLSLLPLWYAEEGDLVCVNFVDRDFLKTLPSCIIPEVTPLTEDELSGRNTAHLLAAPWGLSPQSLRFFHDLNRKIGGEIKVPEWKDEYRLLSGRQTAAYCLDQIKRKLPELHIPAAPLFLKTVDEVVGILGLTQIDAVIKTPFSSSGRGLLWVKEGRVSDKDIDWIAGAIRKQGEVSVEESYKKVADFAVEYRLLAGEISYEGLSMFKTTGKGAYTGNWLVNQDKMADLLASFIGTSVLDEIYGTVAEVLRQTFGDVYEGYIGVDMLIYEENGQFYCHPCVEVNMRNTMGMVAVRLFRRLVSETASGIFTVSYEKDAYEKHGEMIKENPLVLRDGKITKGYLSLCPVTTETRYRAYILIK